MGLDYGGLCSRWVFRLLYVIFKIISHQDQQHYVNGESVCIKTKTMRWNSSNGKTERYLDAFFISLLSLLRTKTFRRSFYHKLQSHAIVVMNLKTGKNEVLF